MDYKHKSVLQSMIVDTDFLTWLLIVGLVLLTNVDFNIDIYLKPGRGNHMSLFYKHR